MKRENKIPDQVFDKVGPDALTDEDKLKAAPKKRVPDNFDKLAEAINSGSVTADQLRKLIV